MLGEPLKETIHQGPETTSIIYAENIRPTDTIVSVGPSASIFKDASILLASSLLSQQGKLYVADPLSEKIAYTYDQLLAKIGGVVTGIGNVDRIVAEIEELQRLGMNLQIPQWLGETSAAQNIPLPDHSVDVISDHDTSVFLADRAIFDNPIQREDTLRDIYTEYSRVLRPGGKILLQTNKQLLKRTRNFKTEIIRKILQESGFLVVEKQIEERIDIPIQPETVDFLKSIEELHDDKSRVRFLGRKVIQDIGTPMLRFDQPDHWSPDLYLGVKIS